MSWKSNLLKIGGVGMMFVPGAGPMIGAGMMAAGQAMDANAAAKKAAEQQTEGVDKGLALTEQMYQQSRADLAPFRTTGASAMSTLGAVMGLPSGGGEAAPLDPGGAPVGPAPRTSRFSEDAVLVGKAQPRPEGQEPTVLKGKARAIAEKRSASSASRPSAAASSMVRMQAPTGQIVMVPSDRVDEATAQGGRVV